MDSSNRNTAIIYGTAGAVAGGVYGYTHPSVKTLDKIENLTQPLSKVYKNYYDSFDKNAVQKAVVNGDIDLATSTKINKAIDAVKDIVDAEMKVEEVFNTPKNQRSETLENVIKDANAKHKAMRKQMRYLKNPELFKKLEDTKILDKKLFLDTLNQATQDLFIKLKLLSKRAVVGAAVGAVSFILAGLGLKSLFNNKVEKTSK